MEIKYEWIISELELIQKIENYNNYVVKCHWRYRGTYENFSKELYGIVNFEYNEIDNYIDYYDLTKEIVESWLEKSINMDELKKQVNYQIELAINPPTISLPLPFSN